MSQKSLINVTVPPSVRSIGDDAFYGTPYLKSLGEFAIINGILIKYHGGAANVTIPETVTEIAGAFCYCENITDITVPSGVTKISSCYAFGKCLSLKNLTFYGDAPYLSDPRNISAVDLHDCVIHASKNNSTWTSSIYYDVPTQTWNGLPIVFDVENPCEHSWNDPVSYKMKKAGHRENTADAKI